ncbi:MAG: tyrosine-type recombinase/integrase [Pseudonocardiales bacterium]|nr:tyrosine-type recombinase/integrase [Pseudonocardiales bacterium]MBV9030670.1 tyrosine-type recombinase/integrase [Pseudonocardiales bacterium]
MDDLHAVGMVGPLGPYARGFAAELARLGFTKLSAQKQMELAAHLSRWLGDAGLGVADLATPVVGGFLAGRRTSGYRQYLTAKALAPLLGYLRGLGVAPQPESPAPRSVSAVLLEDYRCWLLTERGLGVKVAGGYVDAVAPFVTAHAVRGEAGLRELGAGDVTTFMLAQSRHLAPKTVQRLVSALRSLLRFWHLQGLIGERLNQVVPKVANRRPGLPRPLQPGQVRALLASRERHTAGGRRDLAIVTLLARMGLRAGEVAGLRLEDLDWRRGEITIASKGNRRDRLPLPADVGEAIAGYLRDGRPATALDRRVFTRIRAPHQGLTPGGVTQVVAAAARRAGLSVIYAHRLRHSAATSILTEGGSLAEIGQLLRHRRPLTTAAYTKVDIEALRALARPWPGVS